MCVCVFLQLDGIKVEGEAGSMNVSAVALAAVDIAASVVDAALLNVQRTVAKSMEQPEVGMTICAVYLTTVVSANKFKLVHIPFHDCKGVPAASHACMPLSFRFAYAVTALRMHCSGR